MLVRDITQTRQVTEEKIESERLSALTMLAAGVAHELGNPLNSLNIHLQLIERKLREGGAGGSTRTMAELLEVATGRDQAAGFHHRAVPGGDPADAAAAGADGRERAGAGVGATFWSRNWRIGGSR